MAFWGEFVRRMRMLLRREQFEQDLQEEMRLHQELRARENAAGSSSEEARYAAAQGFGNSLALQEASREAWGWTWLERLGQDLRYGLRVLRKSPGFSLVAISVLALGIAANTIVFTVANGTLLNPLPYPDPAQLTMITGLSDSSISYPNFRDLQAQAGVFQGIALHRGDSVNLFYGGGAPERVGTRMVTADLFSIFGVHPLAGRFFTADDDRLGAQPVALLGEGLWKRKFKSDTSIIGQNVVLGERSYTIIGIVPAAFRYFQSSTYLPLGQWAEPAFQARTGTFGTRAVARLKPGMTLDQARDELARVSHTLATEYPEVNTSLKFEMSLLQDVTVAQIRPMVLLFSAAVAVVLLIVCINIATLVLARSASRRHEFAVRAALGARRGRIMRQLLTESMLLAAVGGTLGVLLAAWGTKAAVALIPYGLPVDSKIQLDSHVLLFGLVISLGTGILFGIMPALSTSRMDLQGTLKEGGRGAQGSSQRTQRWLISSEVALATLLLLGTGLLTRSLQRILQVDPGFDPHHVITFSLGLSPANARNPAAIRTVFHRVLEELGGTPGVEGVGLNMGNLPMTGESDVLLWRTDKPRPANHPDGGLWYAVSPDYLRAMQIRLMRGRFFNAQDTENSARVAAMSETMANSLFPGEDPLGKEVHLDFFDQNAEIIGVVADVKQFGLEMRGGVSGIYIPCWQLPDRLLPLLSRYTSIVLRSSASASSLAPLIRRSVQAVDDQQVMYGVIPLEDLVQDRLALRRTSTLVLGMFAGFSVLIAITGIYGVISYLVGQRTQEIGVRMALGATPATILKMIVGRGLRLVLLGMLLGAAIAPALKKFLASELFGITAGDPLTVAAVAVLLLVVAIAASTIPARRAARIDPVSALRNE